jgi:hypothetical protein
LGGENPVGSARRAGYGKEQNRPAKGAFDHAREATTRSEKRTKVPLRTSHAGEVVPLRVAAASCDLATVYVTASESSVAVRVAEWQRWESRRRREKSTKLGLLGRAAAPLLMACRAAEYWPQIADSASAALSRNSIFCRYLRRRNELGRNRAQNIWRGARHR